jgi:hypothetical protein
MENLCCYTPELPCLQPQRVMALGLRLDTQCLPDRGPDLWTIVTAFSLGNGIVSHPSDPSLSSAPQVRDPEVMKHLIMS